MDQCLEGVWHSSPKAVAKEGGGRTTRRSRFAGWFSHLIVFRGGLRLSCVWLWGVSMWEDMGRGDFCG